MKEKVTLFWFRRDLRLEDNKALYHALKEENPVQPIFIFDNNILEKLEDDTDARVTFIYQEIERLHHEIRKKGGSLDVRIGKPIEVWKKLAEDYQVSTLYANRDYEPYARDRDKEVYEFLKSRGIPFKSKKNHVVFEKDEVLKPDGSPYTVYTPYSKKWKERLVQDDFQSSPSETINNWNQSDLDFLKLETIGFKKTSITFPKRTFDTKIVENYDKTRDIPSINGTTKLSVHLRFGTISIRQLMRQSKELNTKYFNELIWREFYQSILWHFPKVVDQNFNSKYDSVEWRNNEEEFEKWCKGITGYPIVDAGMRELNQTGYMHNRVRMIVASFLTKHLLIDWRWGEAYFAAKLLDFELASNNGGWQWASGTGVDAAPYFRVFNPYIQTEKFDPKKEYIRKWVPEFESPDYPSPIVDHSFARERALDAYKEALSDK